MSVDYSTLRKGVGLVTASHDLVKVAGRDAGSFLQDIVSQEVESAQAGETRRSLLLAPQGKLRALLWIHKRDDEEYWIFTDAGFGQRVVEDLNHYRIRIKAEITQSELPFSSVIGPQATGEISAPLPRLPRFFTDHPPGDVQPVSNADATAVRVEEGEPVMGRDVDERTIPQESGLVESAVSLEKGCYLGQELVARIHNRGHVNRHLRGLVLEQKVEEGEVLRAENKDVGLATSVAYSAGLDRFVALSIVKREVEPDNVVSVASGIATVRLLPLDI